jgi:methionine-gamma-lyase
MKEDKAQKIRDIQHFGEEGGVVPVIDHAATSTFLNPDDMQKVFEGEIQGCYLYSRHTNPSVIMFSKKIAAMEGSESALGLASGMSAITCAVLQVMKDGGHMIASDTIYGGTWALFKNILPKFGIDITFVDPSKPEEFKNAIKENTRLIYTETMSNPLLSISDIKSLGELSKSNNLKLIVDNTFTPLIVSPIELGADVVVYSCTKYISGQSDLIAGAICSTEEFIGELIDVNHGLAMLSGPVMDPKVAYELYSRLDTLSIRMRAHSNAAETLVEKMQQEKIPGIIYPGIQSYKQYDLFNQMKNENYGNGGMITLDCENLDRATKLARSLQENKFGLFAVSLGFSRTLLSCPSASTSSEIPKEEQERIGLSDGLLRMSIGFCGDEDILAQRFINCFKELE